MRRSIQASVLVGLHLQDARHVVLVGALHGALHGAIMPASAHTALHWALLMSLVQRASSSQLTAGTAFIFQEWIRMIPARASSLGIGNSIFGPGGLSGAGWGP